MRKTSINQIEEIRLALKPTEKRYLMRLLRRLLHGPVALVAGEGSSGPAIADEDARVSDGLVQLALRQGLAQRSGATLMATEQTAGFLRRAMLPQDDAFADQHRVKTQQTVDVEGVRQSVSRNLAESPLSMLARLKDRSERPSCRAKPWKPASGCMPISPAASCSRVSQPAGSLGCRGAARAIAVVRRRLPIPRLPRANASRVRWTRWGRILPASPSMSVAFPKVWKRSSASGNGRRAQPS